MTEDHALCKESETKYLQLAQERIFQSFETLFIFYWVEKSYYINVHSKLWTTFPMVGGRMRERMSER